MKYYYIFVRDGDGEPSLTYVTSSKKEAQNKLQTIESRYGDPWMKVKDVQGSVIFDYDNLY